MVDSAPVTINENGIRIRAADAALVGLIDLQLKPDFFTQYQTPHDTNHEFGIDVGELKKRICEARKGDAVRLTITNENRERQVRVSVDDRGMTSTFTIPTNTLEEDETPESDELEFAGSAVVAVGALKDAFNRMGDSTRLFLYRDRLVIESTSEEGAASVELVDGSDHIHAIHLDDDPISAMYATDHLQTVTRLNNTVGHVKLQFGTDYPIRVGADRNKFTVEYTLAPRIE